MKTLIATSIFLGLSLCVRQARAEEYPLSDFGGEPLQEHMVCVMPPQFIGGFRLIKYEYHENGTVDIGYIKKRAPKVYEIVILTQAKCTDPFEVLTQEIHRREKKGCNTEGGAICL